MKVAPRSTWYFASRLSCSNKIQKALNGEGAYHYRKTSYRKAVQGHDMQLHMQFWSYTIEGKIEIVSGHRSQIGKPLLGYMYYPPPGPQAWLLACPMLKEKSSQKNPESNILRPLSTTVLASSNGSHIPCL